MRILTPCCAALVLAAAPLVAQAPERGAFVVTLGADTILVEQYTRTRTSVDGDMLIRGTTVVVRHYSGTLRPDGTLARFEYTNRVPANPQAPAFHAVAVFGDTTIVTITRDTTTTTTRVPTPGGALPFISYSNPIYELYGRWAATTHKDTVAILPLGAPSTTPLIVKHPAKDSLTVGFEGVGPTLFRVDARGLIQTVDGGPSTEKVHATRLASVDFAALTAAFQNRPLGQLSPPDSVRASVGGVDIAIDYGRPSVRGRTIFGGVVPWNTVWRTGANFATRFTTSADIVLGGATVPAGTYTLWTLPSPGGWKLIVNRQTKAPCATATACNDPKRPKLWGTDYAADSDLVRVDLQVSAVAQPAEQFVIGVEPQGAGGALWMAWDKTKLSIPFTKK